MACDKLIEKHIGGMTVDIRVLRYFLAVATEESINGAANYLYVSQPTLSRQLMDLEEELGAKLFIRGNRKITLTNEGLYLRNRAQEIIDLFDKTETEFHASGEMIAGDIFIGGGETEAMRIIAKLTGRLQAEYPGIKIHIFSGNADEVTERLDKGLLDFGILIEPADVSKYEYLRLPHREIWGLLMRKDSPLSNKDSISSSDLVGLPIITSRQSLVKNQITGWLGKDSGELNIVATYNLLFNASLLVEEGVGYALCIAGLINSTGDSKLCFKPLSPVLDADLDIVWKKYQVFSSAAGLFLKWLEAEFINPTIL